MKTTIFTVTLMLLVCFAGCKTNKQTEKAVKPDTGMISANVASAKQTLDWTGVYYGETPCADCPGIDVQLTLNADDTYSMTRIYSGHPETIVNSGTFAWNATETKIDLKDVETDGAYSHYIVQEGKLILLTPAGEIPETTDMNFYTLNKMTTDSIDETICNKYWKLVELNGKPVTYKEGVSSVAHILFKADGKVHGSFSCNTFNGSYKVTKGAANRIRFSGLASTMKMCLDMTIENELSRVLNVADSYYVNDGKELILNRARMAPLAKFEVVYMN
ncbi:MAG: META domain-containing protein [Paludibacter sp.]|jgi:heat shock protein HslJ|nr:META domain-containing protein [Paludibacter sp.]